jgi:hypothetical protein
MFRKSPFGGLLSVKNQQVGGYYFDNGEKLVKWGNDILSL